MKKLYSISIRQPVVSGSSGIPSVVYVLAESFEEAKDLVLEVTMDWNPCNDLRVPGSVANAGVKMYRESDIESIAVVSARVIIKGGNEVFEEAGNHRGHPVVQEWRPSR